MFASWLVYLEVVLVVASGIAWVGRLTRCLGLYDPLTILPLMVGSCERGGAARASLELTSPFDTSRTCARSFRSTPPLDPSVTPPFGHTSGSRTAVPCSCRPALFCFRVPVSQPPRGMRLAAPNSSHPTRVRTTDIVLGGIGGGLFFDEFKTLHLGIAGQAGWPLYILGLLLVLSGLYLIADAGARETSSVVQPATPQETPQSSPAPHVAALKTERQIDLEAPPTSSANATPPPHRASGSAGRSRTRSPTSHDDEATRDEVIDEVEEFKHEEEQTPDDKWRVEQFDAQEVAAGGRPSAAAPPGGGPGEPGWRRFARRSRERWDRWSHDVVIPMPSTPLNTPRLAASSSPSSGTPLRLDRSLTLSNTPEHERMGMFKRPRSAARSAEDWQGLSPVERMQQLVDAQRTAAHMPAPVAMLSSVLKLKAAGIAVLTVSTLDALAKEAREQEEAARAAVAQVAGEAPPPPVRRVRKGELFDEHAHEAENEGEGGP